MARIHTYYDNLKVSRDAPDAVIRAAYRALAQQCHPDKNPNSTEAARVMKLINGAYAVLSDPARRLEHDMWITLQEGTVRPTAAPAPERPSGPVPQQSSRRWSDQNLKPLKWVAGIFVVGALMNSIYEPGRQAPRMVAPVDMKADPPLLVPALPAEPPIPAFDDRPPGWPATPSGAGKPLSKPSVRRDAIGGTSADKEGRKRAAPSLPDPDRQSFTGYLPGAPRLASDGLSTFSVDNRSGEQDAVVRLYPNGEKPAVRSFHIKHGQKFTADSMSPGSYVMRYRFIGSNDTFEADKRFILTESETEGGRQFSNVTVTLFRQRDGNLSTRKVAPDEF